MPHQAGTFPIKDVVQAFGRPTVSARRSLEPGLRAGLQGMMSLTPLLAAWAIAVLIYWRLVGNQQQAPVSADLKPSLAAHLH